MSKLYLSDSDGVAPAIDRKKPSNELPHGRERLSRRELLDFIVYLKNQENVTIESRVETHRTLFNTYSFSVALTAKEALKIIKSLASAEEIYARFASQRAKANFQWRIIPMFGYICEEDLVEYLLSLGFSEEEAGELTHCIEERRFKHSAWIKDPRLSGDFKTWANASGGYLQTRDFLPNLFRLAYLEFCHKNTVTDQTAFTVSEHSVRGAYNAYGYLTNRLTGQSSDGLILTYRDNYHRLEKEKLISLAEFFCRQTDMPEMWLRDLNEEVVTVIRQRKNENDDVPAISVHPIEAMARAGSFGSFTVGIYPGDGVYPHFHLFSGKTGQNLAISLLDPEYYRHNADETDCLTEEDTAALADWLDQPQEEMKKMEVSLTNLQYLCILWNQNTHKEKLSLPCSCPDYRRLPTT